MIEIIDLIGSNGILIVIAGIFIYDHITTNKKVQKTLDQNAEMLKSIDQTSANTAKSLELLQATTVENRSLTQENKRIVTDIETKVDCIKRKAGFTS